MFKSVLAQIERHNGNLPIRELTFFYFSHIFQFPKDFYMTGVLNQVMKEVDSVIAFVGSPHFEPIQNLWEEQISFKNVLEVPNRIVGETDNDLIEKQAIFDVLMESRLWSESYIVNPFMYLEKDAAKFTQEDYEKNKTQFKKSLDKYEKQKLKVYEKYDNLQKYEIERKNMNQQTEFSFKNIRNLEI